MFNPVPGLAGSGGRPEDEGIEFGGSTDGRKPP
jgi:hypothetical protein